MSNYYLMRKDIPVCEFDIRKISDDRIAAKLINVLDEKRMPLEMQIEPNIAQYLVRRFAPTLYGNLGYCVVRNGEPLAAGLENIIDYTGGLSLVDDFWMVRKEDKTKSWSECNLFSNEISGMVADMAFTDEGTYEITEFVRSPEFTTDGMVNKAWRRIGGTTYLYKAGLSWKGQYASEPLSEFYAAQIAEKLNLNYVNYDLEMWLGKLCSVCPLFTSERYSYIAAQRLSFDVDSYIQSLDRTSSQYQQLADTVLFDALAINTRHLGNFGFIQDNDTLEIVGISPIFDNGMALLGEIPNRELTNPGYKSVYFIVSNIKFARAQPEEIKAFLTVRQRKLAKEMVDFKFKKHREYNMNDERLELLESIIQHRARYLSSP